MYTQAMYSGSGTVTYINTPYIYTYIYMSVHTYIDNPAEVYFAPGKIYTFIHIPQIMHPTKTHPHYQTHTYATNTPSR